MLPKGFKIRAPGRSDRKYGVAARSLKELLAKACALLQLPIPGCRLCLYEDGTEVTEDYFKTLPDNSELVLLSLEDNWQGYVSEIQRFLNAFSSRAEEIVRAARGLLSEEEAPKRQKLLADLLQHLSENSSAESREEDAKWFEGVESRFKTKSSYMRYCCESRIRGYMKEVGSFASATQPSIQAKFKAIVETMLEQLKLERYNGYYFDRSEDRKVCLCTPEGWFSCQATYYHSECLPQLVNFPATGTNASLIATFTICKRFHGVDGPFDRENCASRHSINPYGNKESRILFSTWNLDHVIEKKRTVLPTLAEAVKNQDGREVNWAYFYQLLFTVKNLKLVHIACHKKSSHSLSCDKSKIYHKRKQVRKTGKQRH